MQPKQNNRKDKLASINEQPISTTHFRVDIMTDINCVMQSIFINTESEQLNMELQPHQLPELLAVATRLNEYYKANK
jgi:hypothetical protein